MIYVGIDPGKNGALALLFKDNSMLIYDLGDFYDDTGTSSLSVNPTKFRQFVKANIKVLGKDVVVCCERPIFVGGGFTIKTPMSMYESFGVIRAVFDGLHIEFMGVKPKEWIQHYTELYHPKKKRDKQESIDLAKKMFPESAEMFEYTVLKGKSKGKKIGLDGRAEAVLIANFARSFFDTSIHE